jgi:hypothetical protein
MRIIILLLVVGLGVLALPATEARADTRAVVPAPVQPAGSQGRFVRDGQCCFPRETPCSACCWEFEVTFGSWLFAMEGQTTIRGRRLDVDMSVTDSVEAIIDHGEGILQGRFRANYGKWGVRLAGSTLTLADGIEFREGGTRGVDAEVGMDLVQFDVAYCLGTCPVGDSCGCPQTLAYEVFAGFRYFNLDGTIEPRGILPGVSGDWDFFDPIIGARAVYDLGNRWSFDVEADIGGFGVGSDFSWSLRVGARYRVARWFSAELGYKLLDIDYADGAGANRFEWDILMHGPYIGLNFHF